MVPLTCLLRRAKTGNKWDSKGFKLNHLLYIDDLKLFDKSKNQTDSLVQTAYIQLGHCYPIWNKEVWSAYQGKRKSD